MREMEMNRYLTVFQQIFAAFCVLMTHSCILLFFHDLASKLRQLLITVNAADTNRFQREFLFNNCIHSQNLSSASKPPRQKTNFLKCIHLSFTEGFQFTGGQLCPLPLLQAFEGDCPMREANETQCGMAYRGGHAANLALFPFRKRKF
jgi:hypothetical protein